MRHSCVHVNCGCVACAEPVVLIAAQPMALGTYPAFKANSIRELIDLAKARPGELSYGAAGVGSGGHLAGEIFKSAAGIDIVPISYKGGNIAMLEVMAVGITRPTGRSRRAIAVRARSRNSSS